MATTHTMQDIAQKVGVHAATVSRALRNHASISPATRSKVKAAAQELGYRPNPLVSALMHIRRSTHPSGFRGTLGYLTSKSPTIESFKADDPWLFDGASARARELGYRLEKFNLHNGTFSADRFSHVLETRNIIGLLLGPNPNISMSFPVDWSKFAVIAIGYSQAMPVSRVAHDQFSGMNVILREARARGTRRIGLVLPRGLTEKSGRRWLSAYVLDQHEGPGCGGPPPLLLPESGAEQAFMSWMQVHRPDIIVAVQHYTPVQKWLKAMRTAVPDQIGLITLDRRMGFDYSGIDQQKKEIGATATTHLVNLIERNERGFPHIPATILLEGKWAEGKTMKGWTESPPKPYIQSS